MEGIEIEMKVRCTEGGVCVCMDVNHAPRKKDLGVEAHMLMLAAELFEHAVERTDGVSEFAHRSRALIEALRTGKPDDFGRITRSRNHG